MEECEDLQAQAAKGQPIVEDQPLRLTATMQVLGRNLRVPRTPQAQKGASGDGVFMRLMALPKGRSMLTRALRVLYAPPSLFEAVPGANLSRHELMRPLKMLCLG